MTDMYTFTLHRIFSTGVVLIFALFLSFTTRAQVSANMNLLGHLDLPDLPTRFGSEYNDCWGFRHANGTEVAIIGGMEDILFVDVTAPGNPEVIHIHHVTNVVNGGDNQSLWRDFKTYGNYAYAAADEGTSGLLIFDLSNVPESVTLAKQTNTFWNRCHNIYIDEDNARLYAAGSNSVSNGLVILNLASNPADPTLLANVPLNTMGGGYVHDVHARDNIVYCNHGSLSKLQMYDMNNLSDIEVIGIIDEYPESGYNHSAWLSEDGNALVMCDETHGSDVKWVDITDPLNISSDDIETFYSELEGADAPGSSVAHNPFILGDHVYVAYYHDGVQVFDISDPNNIVLAGYYDTYPDNTGYSGYNGCWGVYPYLPSGIIIASDQNYGLYVLQLQDVSLDIDFVSLEAQRQPTAIDLQWSVTDVSGGDTFAVMRSGDGGRTYKEIGRVAYHEGQTTYPFTDRLVAPEYGYLYRIDFHHWAGDIASSPLKAVPASRHDIVVKIISPADHTLYIDVLRETKQLRVGLFDMTGRMCLSTEKENARYRQIMDVSDLPSGVYQCVIQWENGMHAQTVSIVR